MRLLPLTLSAHAPSWLTGSHELKVGGGQNSCRSCGLKTASWRELRQFNEDHADVARQTVVPACVLCYLVQHLERDTIDDEALLIWLPEMTQGALNALARGVHLRLGADGDPINWDRRPPSHNAAARSAFSAFMALRDRAAEAESRLGTSSPTELCAALSRAPPDVYAKRDVLLDGLRLLPLGRFFRGGRDIYPALLSDLLNSKEADHAE